MAYLLVPKEVLDRKGVKYYNRMPDGRGIIYDSDAKVLGDLGDDVEIVQNAKDLKSKIASLENKLKK